MPQRLYNQYSAISPLGAEISDKVATFIHSLLGSYPDVDLCDLKGIIDDTLGAEMAVARLTFAAKLRRSQRNDSYSKTSIR